MFVLCLSRVCVRDLLSVEMYVICFILCCLLLCWDGGRSPLDVFLPGCKFSLTPKGGKKQNVSMPRREAATQRKKGNGKSTCADGAGKERTEMGSKKTQMKRNKAAGKQNAGSRIQCNDRRLLL